MGMTHRFLNIIMGLGAGVLAYKLLSAHNDGLIEGEFAEVTPPEEQPTPRAEQAARPAAPPQPPRPNPVDLGKSEPLPRDEAGKLDPTQIADPADFADWDETGCRG